MMQSAIIFWLSILKKAPKKPKKKAAPKKKKAAKQRDNSEVGEEIKI